MIPESRPMSYSRGEITTFVMPHMQNVLGDLFGGDLMARVDQAARWRPSVTPEGRR